MPHNELTYQIALSQIPGIGPVQARKLIQHFGQCSAVLNAKWHQLEKVDGIGPVAIHSILNFNDFQPIENEMELLKKNHISTVFIHDPEYPYRLRQIPDAPILLYTNGVLDPKPKKVISIVGTRRMTPYGASRVEEILSALKGHDLLVISGLAFGVDTKAHECCLKHGIKTLGVMAHGHGHLYPSENRSLATDMVKAGGGLITECLYEKKAERENFPKRNRIVAGMADAVLVIESAKKGGSLITARLANDYAREVLAVPGRVTDYYSSGCNTLIHENAAHLCCSAADIESVLNWEKPTAFGQTRLFEKPSVQELKVCDALQNGTIQSVDDIAIKTGLSPSTTSSYLLSLEFKGIIASLPGKRYQLLVNRYDLEI